MNNPDLPKHELLTTHLVSRFGKEVTSDQRNSQGTYHWNGLVDLTPHNTQEPAKINLVSYFTPIDANAYARTQINVLIGDTSSLLLLEEYRNGRNMELFLQSARYKIPLFTVLGAFEGKKRVGMLGWEEKREP